MTTDNFRAWAEIDLDALLHNHRAVRARFEGAKICAVVKADAYGHGAVRIAQLLAPETDFFAVAMAEEAYELRRAGIETPILILGVVPRGQMPALIKSGVSMTVATYEDGLAAASAAKATGARAKIHLAIDTGMGRIGFLPGEQAIKVIKALAEREELYLEGVFSHFAGADEEDLTFAAEQKRRFDGFTGKLAAAGVRPEIVHMYNSSAICNFPGAYDMAREGLVLYGLPPSGYVKTGNLPGLRAVMTMKSRIVQLKTVPAGTPVSYGSTFVTTRETRVATISVGYGDGVPRLLSGRGELLVGGRRAPIIGRVCMDQLMLDVTGLDGVTVGEEVVLFRYDGSAYLDCTEQAAKCSTINYELLCAVNRRVPRVYLRGGKIESIVNILPEE